MAAAETVKNTVEQFTTAGNAAFKDAIEKSLAGLADANAHSKKNLEAVIASVTAATKGAEALGAQATAYSKKAVEANVAAAKSLSAPSRSRKWSSCKPASPSPPWKPTWPSSPRWARSSPPR